MLADVGRRTGAIQFDTRGVSGGRVEGSGRQLTQVVRNLLDNAARHANGRVAVSVATVGDEVVLSVEDDGPGIAPEDRARVFDRFTRLDAARARDAGGSGLGLALVKRIVVDPRRHRAGRRARTGRAARAFEVRLPSAV